MLKLVLENVTFTSRADEAPRVFTCNEDYAVALMRGRTFTVLGSLDKEEFNKGNYLNKNQKSLIWNYINELEAKLTELNIGTSATRIGRLKLVQPHIDASKAPRTPADLAGMGALILLPTGNTIMIYQILSPFEALMLNVQFSKSYYYALESIHSSSQDKDDLQDYIEYTGKLAGHEVPSDVVVALETIEIRPEVDVDTLARAYAIVRVFGMTV